MIDPKTIDGWIAAVAYNDAPDTYVEESIDLGPAVTALLAERSELIALLREVEWSGSAAAHGDCCPVCGGDSGEQKHESGCRLAAFLR